MSFPRKRESRKHACVAGAMAPYRIASAVRSASLANTT